MPLTRGWLAEVAWQAAVVGAVPGVIGLAIVGSRGGLANAGSRSAASSLSIEDHAHNEVYCSYCDAARQAEQQARALGHGAAPERAAAAPTKVAIAQSAQ